MSDIYNKIINSLNSTRRDILFPPSLLNDLNNEERKDIEERIIKLCLLGDKACFRYLDHIKFFNLQLMFNEETMKNIDSTKRAIIYKRLYYLTKNGLYLGYLFDLCKIDINAYSILTLIYQDDDINHAAIYQALERYSTINDEYKKMFEVRCKNVSEEDIKKK